MSALQGVWARAQEEYRLHQAGGPGPDDPEQLFCLAYVYGVAFGLALSTVRRDLVEKFEPQFRARGWLQEHEAGEQPKKKKPRR
jgi:hypothetical protein